MRPMSSRGAVWVMGGSSQRPAAVSDCRWNYPRREDIPGRDAEQQRRPVRTASAGTNVAGLLSVRRGDVHDAAAALGAELHLALRKREQRVVATAADVLARVEVSAVLADDDLADAHGLTAEALDTKPLGVGVTAVLRGRCALFVCHVSTPHLIPVTLTWVYR